MKMDEDMLDRMAEKYRKYMNKIKVLIKNDDYINWLESFTEKHPFFDEEIELEIMDENVYKLRMFYDIIEEYAINNSIQPKNIDEGMKNAYLIKNNGIGYKIGYISGQGSLYIVDKEEQNGNNLDDFIDFKLIQEESIAYEERPKQKKK